MSEELTISNDIKSKIHTIRGKQVMLDSDLAKLYGVETKVLNQAVKRNLERFPSNFMFQLTKEEFYSLRSQFVTLEVGKGKHKKYLPLVFTEQGVSMLSAVLKSKKAVEVSINIINAFVAMRKFLSDNKYVFEKFQQIDQKLVTHDKQFNQIFKALESKDLPEKGIFFDGQVFDAFVFVSKLIKKAEKEIVLIDNYVDENTLDLMSKKNKDAKVIIYTKNVNKIESAIKKFNEQYKDLDVIQFDKSHDRFLIIDNSIYHVGASLKDLGRKWFAFSKLNMDKDLILSRLKL